MTSPRTRFYLDKQNKKWAGVCAGVADYTGIDVTVVRIAVVVLTFLSGPWTFLAYVLAAWMAPKKPASLYDEDPDEKKFWQGVRASPRRTARAVRARFRDIDRRLADVETYVTSSNSRLAREIEQLR
ncbi:MAG TPA: envelope stress response membrane protein PspC [Allosphingosinicella sp.]|jgi:phage shock protein C|nr:envelope stress response membrane protein PspC [Allosphingosinicella sp.]